MIVVKIELHSAITGKIQELGRTYIANTGGGTGERGEYDVAVCRKGNFEYCGMAAPNILRNGEVTNYPRLSYNVWRLVIRALKSAFPEEK